MAPTIESSLADLIGLVRKSPAADFAPVRSGRVPDDLRTDTAAVLSLDAQTSAAAKELVDKLDVDLRFEHLSEREATDAVWRLVCQAALTKETGLAKAFVETHAKDLITTTCFRPVELLTVASEVPLVGAWLLPAETAALPEPFFGPDPRSQMGCAIAVQVTGTSGRKMSDRARATAERALRILRIALRAHTMLPDIQLRFRLGTSVWFEDGGSGWQVAADQGADLHLDDSMVALAAAQPVTSLPFEATTEIERRVDLALRWLEAGQLATERDIELLYLFFALETILGDRAEKLKGPNLALRRAMLGLITVGHFADPSRINVLYDRGRSLAVHGEHADPVSEQVVDRLAWDVRAAINEFLQLAAQLGATTRKGIRKVLDTDQRRPELIASLLEEDPSAWKAFADQ